MASSSTTVGTVKGNISGSNATPSDLTLTSADTASSVIYRDSNAGFSAGTGTFTNPSGTTTSATLAIDPTTASHAAYMQMTNTGGTMFFGLSDGSGNPNGTVGYEGWIVSPTQFYISAGVKNATFKTDGSINLPNLTASQAVVTDSSKNLASLGYGSSNTISTLVERDGSGNFSAGNITGSAFISSSSNPATTGVQRLANTDTIAWRDGANTVDLPLSVSNGGSQSLRYNGNNLFSSAGVLSTGTLPAFTGDITTTAGSVSTTAAATQPNITTFSNASGITINNSAAIGSTSVAAAATVGSSNANAVLVVNHTGSSSGGTSGALKIGDPATVTNGTGIYMRIFR